MAKFDSILGTVGNTPVVRINRLAPKDVNLFVKIEAFNPLGSVKDRLALGVIEAAEKSGDLKPGQTVIEATSGNTGIGLAMVCAAKGYPLVVTMAETFSVERRRLMRFLGAKVVLTPASGRGFGMVSKAEELAAKNGIRLWQSESGPLGRKEKGWDNFLMMGQRIITDMRELQPSAWCDWQYMSGAGLHDVWALVGYAGRADSGFHYARTKGFYCRSQFSRFIVPGSVFIGSEGKNTLAALSPDNKRMVLVVINQDSSEQVMRIDLSRFRSVKNTSVFVTDESRDCESRPLIDCNNKKNIPYSLPGRSVATFVFETTIK